MVATFKLRHKDIPGVLKSKMVFITLWMVRENTAALEKSVSPEHFLRLNHMLLLVSGHKMAVTDRYAVKTATLHGSTGNIIDE